MGRDTAAPVERLSLDDITKSTGTVGWLLACGFSWRN